MMMCFPFGINRLFLVCVALFCSFYTSPSLTAAMDLDKPKQAEVLDHPDALHAHSVPSTENGINPKLMRRFATYLEVKHQYAQKTGWSQNVSEATEKKDQIRKAERTEIGATSDRSDIIANGATTFSWRQKVSRFTSPIFPNQEWLIGLCGCTIN